MIGTHPFDAFREYLANLVERLASGGRHDQVVIRVRHNGAILGHTCMRSVVEEAFGEPDDQIKFYGLRFFLPLSGFRSSRPIRSACGTLIGVEAETNWGTIAIDSPALLTPSLLSPETDTEPASHPLEDAGECLHKTPYDG